MGTRRDSNRSDSLAVAGTTLDLLHIQRGGERVHPLAHDRSASGMGPHAVILRVRTGMGLLPVHPQDLGAGLLQNFPFLLDRRSEHPILRIGYGTLALLLRLEDPSDTGHGTGQGLHPIQRLATEIGRPVAKITGERFFDDAVPVHRKRSDRYGLVGGGGRAYVHHIAVGDQFIQRCEGSDTPLPGKVLASFGRSRVDADNLDMGLVDPPERFIMERGGKPRTDQTSFECPFPVHQILHQTHPPTIAYRSASIGA